MHTTYMMWRKQHFTRISGIFFEKKKKKEMLFPKQTDFPYGDSATIRNKLVKRPLNERGNECFLCV
jgi:hypothetical protein